MRTISVVLLRRDDVIVHEDARLIVDVVRLIPDEVAPKVELLARPFLTKSGKVTGRQVVVSLDGGEDVAVLVGGAL